MTVYMKIDSHSGVGRYPVLVPAYAGMTSWVPDRVRNDMRHFHVSLCLNKSSRLVLTLGGGSYSAGIFVGFRLDIGWDKVKATNKKGLRLRPNPLILFGGRCATRTRGLWFRRPTLYPPELIAHASRFKNWQAEACQRFKAFSIYLHTA